MAANKRRNAWGLKERDSAILLHISSLPSGAGIGTLGQEAYAFVDFLKQCGCTVWQMLPIGPTGFGDSPYQSASTHAGNPLFVDCETLVREGLLDAVEPVPPEESKNVVHFEAVRRRQETMLARAFALSRERLKKEVDAYRNCSFWVEDYALFTALKELFRRGSPVGVAGRGDPAQGTRRPGPLPEHAGRADRIPHLRAVPVPPAVGKFAFLLQRQRHTIAGGHSHLCGRGFRRRVGRSRDVPGGLGAAPGEGGGGAPGLLQRGRPIVGEPLLPMESPQKRGTPGGYSGCGALPGALTWYGWTTSSVLPGIMPSRRGAQCGRHLGRGPGRACSALRRKVPGLQIIAEDLGW